MFQIKKIDKREKINSLSSLKTTNSENSNKFIIFEYSPTDIKFLSKKMFKVKKKKDDEIEGIFNSSQNYGLWEKSEHMKFIEALYLYNCDWMKMVKYLKNRNPIQIRSHAQKLFLKLKSFIDDELGLDFTSSNVKNLKDIIQIIKKKEYNINEYGKLFYIISEKISFGKNVKREKNNVQSLLLDEKNHLNDSEHKDEYKYENNKIDLMNTDELSILKSKNSNIDTNYRENDNFLLDTEENINDIFSLNINNKNDLIFLQKMLL